MIFWIGLFFFLIAALFFIPLVFSFQLAFPSLHRIRIDLWKGGISLEWDADKLKFGFFRWTFALSRASSKPPKPKPAKTEKHKKEKPKKKKFWKNARSILSLLQNEDLRKTWIFALKQFFRSLFSVVRFHRLCADLTLGLETPSQTGMAMGWWYALEATTGEFWPKKISLKLSPDFTRKTMEGFAQIEGQTSLFRMMMPVLRLFWYAPLFRTYKIFR